MHIATLHNGEKVYNVDMEAFGWVHEDAEEGEGLEVFAEESLENNTPILNYWDGSNWRMDYIESEPEEIEYSVSDNQPIDPEPAYYEISRIEIGGEEIDIVSSSISGNITPYWTEERFE